MKDKLNENYEPPKWTWILFIIVLIWVGGAIFRIW